jgi:hypothetical protein
VKITNTIRVDATPEEAWRIVGDLTAVDKWIPGIVGARVDGSRRVCTTADGGEIVERITSYSDDARSYSYAHVVQPLPIENSRGTLSVKADGDGSLVVWEAEFEPAAAEVTGMVETAYRRTLDSLAGLLEQRRTGALFTNS